MTETGARQSVFHQEKIFGAEREIAAETAADATNAAVVEIHGGAAAGLPRWRQRRRRVGIDAVIASGVGSGGSEREHGAAPPWNRIVP